MTNFRIFFLTLNAIGACLAWARFSTDKFTEKIYKVVTFEGKNIKYKYIFYKASSLPLPSPLLELPNSPTTKVVGSTLIEHIWFLLFFFSLLQIFHHGS